MGKYQVIRINPELLMGNNDITKFWAKPHITKCILYFVFDEGHCVSQWNNFQKEYQQLGDLRFLIPETIPFYVASAMLPDLILLDDIEIL
jgi:superfamily II DNA helicase RecQ